MGLGFKYICGSNGTSVYLSRDFDEAVYLRREKHLGRDSSLHFSFNRMGVKLIDILDIRKDNVNYRVSVKGERWLEDMDYDCSSKGGVDAAIVGLMDEVLKGLPKDGKTGISLYS